MTNFLCKTCRDQTCSNRADDIRRCSEYKPKLRKIKRKVGCTNISLFDCRICGSTVCDQVII